MFLGLFVWVFGGFIIRGSLRFLGVWFWVLVWGFWGFVCFTEVIIYFVGWRFLGVLCLFGFWFWEW